MRTLDLKEQYRLERCTTIGIGGPARLLALAAGPAELRGALALAAEKGLPAFILGGGSNVLAGDDGFEGLVVRLGDGFRHVGFDRDRGEVAAGGGAPLIKLGAALARQGFSGCAFMGVIPGSVGGAVRMNAGTGPGQEIAAHLLRVRVLDPASLEERWRDARELQLSYRSCALSRTREIVLEAVFRLPAQREAAPGDAFAAIRQLYAARRAAQPRARQTFGSVFKNPAGAEHAAGWYLERAGMKGLRAGGAMVPREHANWIVNMGGARCREVKELMETGRTRVFERFGIRLEREVVLLPDDAA